MKKNVKLLLACAVSLMLVTTAVAAYWIYSNIVTVTVTEYVLTLAPSSQTVLKYDYASFTATLTLGGSPVSGVVIELFFGNGTSTGVTNTTIADGTCLLQWNATEVGTLEFKAGYQTP